MHVNIFRAELFSISVKPYELMLEINSPFELIYLNIIMTETLVWSIYMNQRTFNKM